ncbi:Pr6Pr family membrane protein [Agromyces marinus]|uniref:FAR-17a/AIG1-like protein n=1 Tax=Agromyces marinus TaxID=1389020 RepID=A0ABN6YFQ3_9MICO|nr:Pr6Pr family membrane protein [Agromyces marinus]UIP57602.1 hypothetical protein DSM26151_04670 [Agromyces marinus]BDZ54248.1 hypothetical protein GCM10025870_13210 [Agromyces marinus]
MSARALDSTAAQTSAQAAASAGAPPVAIANDPADAPVTRATRTSRARRSLGVFRLAIVVLEIVALVGNYRYVLEFPLFASANFFSYFTIQSAMLAVIVLLVAAVFALTQHRDPPWLAGLRTMVTVYLLVSGIVFAIIAVQASTRDYRLEVPWSDTLLHFVVPALALAAWTADAVLAVNPPVPWATVGWVLVFPAGWLGYTLVRGADVGWYPYFFLDASQVGGYGGIAAYCALVLLIFLAITAVLVSVHRRFALVGVRRRIRTGGQIEHD